MITVFVGLILMQKKNNDPTVHCLIFCHVSVIQLCSCGKLIKPGIIMFCDDFCLSLHMLNLHPIYFHDAPVMHDTISMVLI